MNIGYFMEDFGQTCPAYFMLHTACETSKDSWLPIDTLCRQEWSIHLEWENLWRGHAFHNTDKFHLHLLKDVSGKRILQYVQY